MKICTRKEKMVIICSLAQQRIIFIFLEVYSNTVTRPMCTAARTEDDHIPSRSDQPKKFPKPATPSPLLV